MKNFEFNVEGHSVTGTEIALPVAPLVLAQTQNGFVMCGYLNIEAANKLNVAAALVRGVKTVDDLLKAKIEAVSAQAEKRGVKIGDTGQQALAKLV